MSDADNIARSRELLRQGVGTTTRRNRVLPAARLPTPIPERVGTAGPREEVGSYVEVDYALRVLETDNSMTYHYDMMNTPLDGNMRLYLQPRPRDTTAGDDNYYASTSRLTTTDGLLKTDYQLTLKTAMIRPSSGADRVVGFGANPVTAWFTDFDLIRGPTGVHAIVKKPRRVDMIVDGTAETLTLKPPPYTTPAGNGLCALDAILKLGDPWHGLIQGGTLRLPGGKTRPVARPGIGVGVVYPLIPYGVTPAATADAADVAAGRTWLNYGLLAGACLYEQSIASAFPCWVYIAPDNSTWRVAYAHVLLSGIWNLQLQFYPLRRVFLTSDKWGGLVQTISTPVTPTPWSYTGGTLHDLDSKGAQAIFVSPGASKVASAALATIQGVPPNASCQYTLVIDDAEPGPQESKLYSPVDMAIILDYSRVDVWQAEWLDTWATPPTEYTQNILAGDPSPYPLGSGTPTGWRFVSETIDGIFNSAAYTVGFAFDKNDNLTAAKTRYESEYHFFDTTYPDPADPLRYLRHRTVTGPCWTRQFLSIGISYADEIEDAGATWVISGWSGPNEDVPIYAPNAYGDYGSIPTATRYSNRLFGLRLENSGMSYWLPPISPDALSTYPAAIANAGAKPFGTYHPITQQIVWETGFVNFV